MRKILVLITSLLLLTPALALAQGPLDIRANAKAEAHASTTFTEPRPVTLPKLGPALKELASSTRAEWKANASTTREATKERAQTRKRLAAEVRADFKQYANDVKQRIKGRFGERIEKLAVAIPDRLASTSARLTNMADRMDARIDALETTGHDMSGSIESLSTARASIAVADEKIFALNALFDTASSTETIKSQMSDIRVGVKTAQDALALAKKNLQETLRSIRAEAAATTTVSN